MKATNIFNVRSYQKLVPVPKGAGGQEIIGLWNQQQAVKRVQNGPVRQFAVPVRRMLFIVLNV